MIYEKLGKTPFLVSPVGLGTLTLGPYQLNMSIEKGAKIIVEAVKRGINLIDTAKIYKTYPYIREALNLLLDEEKSNLHIISRSYDYTFEGMKESFSEALRDMGIDRISVFMLHEMESALTIEGHRDALEYLLKMKSEGILGATGISTHYIKAVKSAADHPDIDVIFAILNRQGMGIMDGTAAQMEEALNEAYENGKGIILMKALGGGHLYESARESLEYARNLPFVHSVMVGMQDESEIDYNVSVFKRFRPQKIAPNLSRPSKRRLFIEPWCCGCGKCSEVCPFGALKVIDGRANVDEEICMLCSYCARACPDFCIKVV